MMRRESQPEQLDPGSRHALFELADPPVEEDPPTDTGLGGVDWYWGYYCSNPRFDPAASPTVLEYELSARGRWLWGGTELTFATGSVVMAVEFYRFYKIQGLIRAAVEA